MQIKVNSSFFAFWKEYRLTHDILLYILDLYCLQKSFMMKFALPQ